MSRHRFIGSISRRLKSVSVKYVSAQILGLIESEQALLSRLSGYPRQEEKDIAYLRRSY